METKEQFIADLKPWMVFYFKDVEVSEHIPHYFVIINQNIQDAPVLVLPVSTSQIEKRKEYYKRCNFDSRCLVIVESHESNDILSKTSAFDCNQVKNKWILDIYELFVKWKACYKWTLPNEIIQKLRTGVLLSNQVEPWVKDLV